MGCSPSILSSFSKNNNNNRKDSGLYCSNNNSDTNSKFDFQNDSDSGHALANQMLVIPGSTSEKVTNVFNIYWFK